MAAKMTRMRSVQVYEGDGIERSGYDLPGNHRELHGIFHRINIGCDWKSTWPEHKTEYASMADLFPGLREDTLRNAGDLLVVIKNVQKLRQVCAVPKGSSGEHPFTTAEELGKALTELLKVLQRFYTAMT